MFQGLNMKVTIEMRDEVLNGYLGQWFANATSKSNGSANEKELHIKEGSFESRNRKAFWSLIHPRKESNGTWLPFEGPVSLRESVMPDGCPNAFLTVASTASRTVVETYTGSGTPRKCSLKR